MDRLEAEYQNRLQVIRVDIQSSAGKTIAREYGIFATPSFLLFDRQGHEIIRSVGNLDTDQIRYFLDNP